MYDHTKLFPKCFTASKSNVFDKAFLLFSSCEAFGWLHTFVTWCIYFYTLDSGTNLNYPAYISYCTLLILTYKSPGASTRDESQDPDKNIRWIRTMNLRVLSERTITSLRHSPKTCRVENVFLHSMVSCFQVKSDNGCMC